MPPRGIYGFDASSGNNERHVALRGCQLTSLPPLPPIVYEGCPLLSVRVYRGRCRHVWLVVRRERRLDEHVCLQVGRVGISLDNVGKRGF